MKSLATLLVLAAAAAAPAHASTPQAAAPAAADAAAAAVAAGNRRFTLNLHRELTREHDGNLFFSAPSVAFAFAPLQAGAAGETRAAIGRSLSYPDLGDALQRALGALQRGLERDADGTTISIANALWLGRDFTPAPAFLDNARSHHGASVERLDFGGDPAGSAARINAWASEETRGRITRVIDPTGLTRATRLIVSNAVYFLADWRSPFPAETRPGPFTSAGGDRRDVPMMEQVGFFRHHDGAGFAALDLPYRDERLVMTVLLPDEAGGLAALERRLTPALLDRTLGALDRAEPQRVHVKLPKLELRATYPLNDALSRLGMGIAFAPRADFSGVGGGAPLAIDSVRQFTFLRVDEKGTEAAAVTTVGIIVSGSRIAPRPIPFHADRPFLFMLRDRESGAILFFGRIVSPQS